MADTSEIKLTLTIDGKDALATIKLTDDEIKKLAQSFLKAKENARDTAQTIVHDLTSARNSIQGFREIYSVFADTFAKPLQLQIDLEQAKTTFSTFLGSVDQAETMLKQLQSFSAKTPLQFADVRNAALQLMQFGTSASDIIPTLKMLGDVAGGNAERFQRLALAFGQISSQGRLTGQDLMQLINAGFNPLQIIADKTGKSITTLKKEMEEGKVTFQDVKQAFIDVTSEGGNFFNLMEKQSETLGGKLSTLKDNFDQLQTSVGGTIAVGISPLVDHLTSLINTINRLPEPIRGAIGTVGFLTSALILLRVTGVGAAVKELLTMRPALLSTAATAGTTSVAVTGLGASFRAAGLAVKGFFTSLGPIGWALIGLTAIVEAFNLFSSSSDDAATSVEQFEDKFKNFNNSKFKDHITETNKLIDENKNKIEELRNEYNSLSKKDTNNYSEATKIFNRLNELREEINNRIENGQKLQQYLNQLTTEYNNRNKASLELLQQQVGELRKKIALEKLTGNERKIEELKQQNLQEKELLKKALEEKLITTDEYNQLVKDLETNYTKSRQEILSKSYAETTKKKMDALIKELDIERDFVIKSMELNNANKNDVITKEIEYLNKKRDILLKFGQNTFEIDNQIRLKELELQKNKENNDKDYQLKQLEREQEINKLRLELEGATKDQLLQQEIDYLEKKKSLIEQYGGEVFGLETELMLKRVELDNARKLAGIADDQTKESYRKELESYANATSEKYKLLESWKEKEIAKYYNDEEAKTLILEVYEKRRTEIAEQESQIRANNTRMALSFISSAYAKHTLISKLASASLATINTYEAATKALTAGPLIGPILAGFIIAAGLANVAKIMSTETPQAVGYAKGGIALVGEKGPEIIAPAMDYAQGQAMLINAVTRQLDNRANTDFAEKLLNKLDNWKDRLEFRISRGDLYSSWVEENKFRTNYGF